MRPATVVATALALLAATPAAAQTVVDPALTVRPVVTSGGILWHPSSFAILAPNDFLVLEKEYGTVRRILYGALQPQPMLDLAVNNASERGILGIALHPDFATNGYVYLYWTESSTGQDTNVTSAVVANRVTRFTWNGYFLESPADILRLPVTPGPNHDGGYMIFGPDGKLYIQTGDLNRNGMLQNYPGGPAPDSTSTILRVNDDGSSPADNPFVSLGPSMSASYAYGIRNQFGMAFDPATQRLWQTENGPVSYDEINLVLPGFNSGWEQLMGPDARDPQGVGDLWLPSPAALYSDPEFSWLSPICVTAVAFPDVNRFGAAYGDAMLVAGCHNSRIFRFRLNPARDAFVFAHPGLLDRVGDSEDEMAELVWGTDFYTITDMKVGPEGDLYVLSWGGLFRIAPVPTSVSVGDAPAGAAAAANAPNPFAARTSIRFDTRSEGRVTVTVFDVAGRKVRALLDASLAAGAHAVEWDGRDGAGRALPAGIYHYRIEEPGGVRARRAILLR